MRNLSLSITFLALLAGCSSTGKKDALDHPATPEPIATEFIGLGFTGSHGVTQWGDQIAVTNSYGKPPSIGVVSGTATAPRVLFTRNMTNPIGITALPDGRLLFCDVSAGAVLLIEAEGKVIAKAAAEQPWNTTMISANRGGVTLALVQNTGEIGLLNITGDSIKHTTLLANIGPNPFGVAWHPGLGQLLVTMQADGKVFALPFDPENSGAPIRARIFAMPLDNPEGIAVDDSGNVWIAETAAHRVAIYDAEGVLLARTAPGVLRFPVAVVAAGDDTVLIGCGGDSGKVFRMKYDAKAGAISTTR
jgi:sugar lactone lactonase YvrE